MSGGDAQSSASATRGRFDTHQSSIKYARALDGTPTHRREISCIKHFLSDVPANAKVLDIPCGAGRLLPILSASKYRVFAADSSSHMLARARERVAQEQLQTEIEFGVEDIFDTPFFDSTFDAVICNRLFHHFFESEVRISALRELRRVTRGPIIVSFFCSRSVSSSAFLLKNRLRKNPVTDRVPIPLSTITAEAKIAGLKVDARIATKPFLGKQWYLKLLPS